MNSITTVWDDPAFKEFVERHVAEAIRVCGDDKKAIHKWLICTWIAEKDRQTFSDIYKRLKQNSDLTREDLVRSPKAQALDILNLTEEDLELLEHAKNNIDLLPTGRR